MRFKILVIEKRSSEVCKILGTVKTEFEKFGGLLEKSHKNILTGLGRSGIFRFYTFGQLDQVSGVRTRAIQRKLKRVESLIEDEVELILSEITSNEIDEQEDTDL